MLDVVVAVKAVAVVNVNSVTLVERGTASTHVTAVVIIVVIVVCITHIVSIACSRRCGCCSGCCCCSRFVQCCYVYFVCVEKRKCFVHGCKAFEFCIGKSPHLLVALIPGKCVCVCVWVCGVVVCSVYGVFEVQRTLVYYVHVRAYIAC